MIIMSITILFIMLVIGSSLARAFSLVGALSIIRFRNAVKDSRDTAFIFLAMAVGMACGTRLYALAVPFTIFASSVLLFLNKINFGSINKEERLMHVKVPGGWDKNSEFENNLLVLTKKEYKMLSKEYLGEGSVVYIYSVQLPLDKLNDVSIEGFRRGMDNTDIRLMKRVYKKGFASLSL